MADVVRLSDFKELSSLTGGIINDAQALIGKEISLAKLEMKQEIERIHRYSAVLAWKWAAIALSQILLAMAFVFFLSEKLSMPLWAAFAIVSLLSGGIAFALSQINRAQVPFQTNVSILKNLKESLQCLTKQKS